MPLAMHTNLRSVFKAVDEDKDCKKSARVELQVDGKIFERYVELQPI